MTARAASPTFWDLSTTSHPASTSLTYPSYATHSKTSAHPLDALSTHQKHAFSPQQMHFHSPSPPHNQPHLSRIHHEYNSGILNTTPPNQQTAPSLSVELTTGFRLLGQPVGSLTFNNIPLLPCRGRQRKPPFPINFHHRRTNETQTLLPMPPPKPTTSPII